MDIIYALFSKGVVFYGASCQTRQEIPISLLPPSVQRCHWRASDRDKMNNGNYRQ